MYAPSGTEDSELNTDVTEDSKLNTDVTEESELNTDVNRHNGSVLNNDVPAPVERINTSLRRSVRTLFISLSASPIQWHHLRGVCRP